MITKGSRERGKARGGREAGREGGHHGHVCEIEPPWGADCHAMVIHGEVAVAVRVGAGRCDVRGVQHICIDKVELEGFVRLSKGP